MNFYDYIFYRVYKSTSTTNKSIPEWSTIIAISAILSINFFSILLILGYKLQSMSETIFRIIPLIILGINYFVFLFNKRYLDILNKYSKSQLNKNIIHDIIIVIYASLSVFILFYLLKVEYKYSLILIGAIITTSIYGYTRKSDNDIDGDTN